MGCRSGGQPLGLRHLVLAPRSARLDVPLLEEIDRPAIHPHWTDRQDERDQVPSPVALQKRSAGGRNQQGHEVDQEGPRQFRHGQQEARKDGEDQRAAWT